MKEHSKDSDILKIGKMIQHIVMWTVRGETDKLKSERMVEMKSRLLALKKEIKEITEIKVSFNSPAAPADNFDIVLHCSFNSWADLELYQNHPAHVAVADYIKNIRQNRAAIDYEF